jgi:zinc/manganese transport system permease protein
MTLPDLLFTPFTDFAFMRRALVGCVALSLGAAPLGVLLTLRRMSLMGDALSHAILPGVAAGFAVAGLSFTAMSLGGLIAGLIVALLAGLAAHYTKQREESSFAAFYLIAVSAGVMLLSLHGKTVDLVHILFGRVLAIDTEALVTMASVTSLTLLALALFYRQIITESFDPNFLSNVTGSRRRAPITQALFLTLVVLNLVAGFQTLGTLQAVGLMMLPAVTARYWATEVWGLSLTALTIALISSLSGLLLSYHTDTPSGPAIILTAGAIYLASLLFGRRDSLRARYFPAPHLER